MPTNRAVRLAALSALLTVISMLAFPRNAVAQRSLSPKSAPAETSPAVGLPFLEQVEVYTLVLSVAAVRVLWPGAEARLLLDPRPPLDPRMVTRVDTLFPMDSAALQQFRTPLEPTVATALVLTGAAQAVCDPAPLSNVCKGHQRGLAARLSPIVKSDSTHARAWVFVTAVAAEGDKTIIASGYRYVTEVRLVRSRGHWLKAD